MDNTDTSRELAHLRDENRELREKVARLRITVEVLEEVGGEVIRDRNAMLQALWKVATERKDAELIDLFNNLSLAWKGLGS